LIWIRQGRKEWGQIFILDSESNYFSRIKILFPEVVLKTSQISMIFGGMMKDKIVLITGANRGIGKETTRALARKGATIIMACRNLEKAEPVCEMIQTESKNPNIKVMKLDLASLESVRNFTQEFKARYQKLNVLINNAGVFCMKREETEEGFELIMGVNHLGHFLLTHELLPILQKTPEARIVNLSSDAHSSADLDLDDRILKGENTAGLKLTVHQGLPRYFSPRN
jgi:hypothetical protein